MEKSSIQNSTLMSIVNSFHQLNHDSNDKYQDTPSIVDALKNELKVDEGDIDIPNPALHYAEDFVVKGKQIEVFDFKKALIAELEDYLLDPNLKGKNKEAEAFLNLLSSCTYESIGKYNRLSNTNYFFRYM